MITRKMAVEEIEHFLRARRNYYAHEIADGVVSRIDETYAQIERLAKERDKLKELNSALCAKSNSQVIHNARLAEENEALRAKVEAAESDAAHQKALAESALRVAEGRERKCGELRALVATLRSPRRTATTKRDQNLPATGA